MYTRALSALALISVPIYIYGLWLADVNNNLVPAYCVIICIWSTLFLKAWSRENSVLTHRWNCAKVVEADPARPEYLAHPKLTLRRGIFTPRGFVEDLSIPEEQAVKYFPQTKRIMAILLNAQVTVIAACGVMAAVVAIFNYKLVLRATYPDKLVGQQAQTISALANTVFMQIMNLIWSYVSVRLTDLEVHRSDREYENALIAKAFVFRFVNSFGALFYLAFVAGSHLSLFGMRGPHGELLRDSCPAPLSLPGEPPHEPDCLLALHVQMQSYILVMQGVRHVTVLVPLVYLWLRRRCGAGKQLGDVSVDDMPASKAASARKLRARIEAELARPEYPGTYAEYDEMCIQYGQM